MSLDKSMSIRAEVSNAIENRKEKGTLKSLEELKQDVGQWGEYVEIVTCDPESELSEDDQIVLLALMNDVKDAVDQLLDALEKLINLTGVNTEIVQEYFDKINKMLDQTFGGSENRRLTK